MQRQPAEPRWKTKRDSFAEARRVVLRVSVRADMQRCDNERTAFGMKADVFKPPSDEARGCSAAWIEGSKKFDKLSQSYEVQNYKLSRFGRAAFPKLTMRDSAKQLVCLTTRGLSSLRSCQNTMRQPAAPLQPV